MLKTRTEIEEVFHIERIYTHNDSSPIRHIVPGGSRTCIASVGHTYPDTIKEFTITDRPDGAVATIRLLFKGKLLAFDADFNLGRLYIAHDRGLLSISDFDLRILRKGMLIDDIPDSQISCVAITLDRKYLLISIDKDEVSHVLRIEDTIQHHGILPGASVRFINHPDCDLIAACDAGQVSLLSISNGQFCIFPVQLLPLGQVVDACFTSDGSRLILLVQFKDSIILKAYRVDSLSLVISIVMSNIKLGNTPTLPMIPELKPTCVSPIVGGYVYFSCNSFAGIINTHNVDNDIFLIPNSQGQLCASLHHETSTLLVGNVSGEIISYRCSDTSPPEISLAEHSLALRAAFPPVSAQLSVTEFHITDGEKTY